MFSRREKRTPFQNLKEMLIPSMGWDRTVEYFRHRLFRNADSTFKITAGLAVGISISFNPFLGTHIFLAMFFCWLFRFNVFAGIMGTVAGNPWTFPFMFWLDYKIGAWLFQVIGIGDLIVMPDTLTLSYLFAHPLKLFLPLTLGGLICNIAFWPVAYALCYLPVRQMRRAYRYQRLLARRKRRAAQRANLT